MDQVDTNLGSQSTQLVVFTLAGETYGVDIYQVREIIRVPDVTRVPNAPDYVEGIINLRGGVIPVLDLRRRFGMPPQDVSSDSRIVIVELADKLVGMRVDGVTEVLRIEATQIEPPSPYIVTIESQFVTGIARVNDNLILLMDLNLVLNPKEHDELQQIANAG